MPKLGLQTIGVILIGLSIAQPVSAASFGNRPVTVLVGFGPGGLGDIVTRIVVNKMSESVGVPFVVNNVPGASGMTAASQATRAEPDGHTILLVSGQNAASPSLFKAMPFDPAQLTPLGTLGFFDFVFLVHKSSPIKTLDDLIKAAKTDPAHFNIGTISVGSVQNLAALLFLQKAGLKAQVVPSRSTGDVVTALNSGEIQAAVETVPGVIGQIQSGDLRALAISAATPVPYLPGVPTVASRGIDFKVSSWNGFMLPVKTPKETVDYLNKEMVKAMADHDVADKLTKLGLTPQASSPQELQKLYDEDVTRWQDVISQAHIAKQ